MADKKELTPLIDPADDPAYLAWLRAWAKKSGSDGCTFVSEIHHDCCLQHDYACEEGFDPREVFEGRLTPMSRRSADALFRRCNQSRSPLGRFSPMSWWRWVGVRIGAWF